MLKSLRLTGVLICFGLFSQIQAQGPAAVQGAENTTVTTTVTETKIQPQPVAPIPVEPQKTEEAAKDGDKKEKPDVVNVVESLKRLMMPSGYAEQIKQTTFTSEPYFKVIKGSDNRSTFIYTCRNTSAKSLVNAVETMLSAQGVVEQSAEQNMLVVNDRSDKMDELRDAILAMDISVPQLLVEAKIVEVLVSDSVQRDFSVMWNRYDARQNLTSAAGSKTDVPNQQAADKNKGADVDWYPVLSGGIGDSSYSNLNTAMQWLLKADDAKILSAPNVLVSRNTTASIVTGNDIPLQTIQVVSGSTTTSTEFKRIGVKLNVTPSLINDNYATLLVNPQVSNVQRYESIKQGDATYPVPVIAIRNIETQLTVRDGQVILLGGLYSTRDSSSTERMPIVSDLPLLGDMFTGKNVSKDITQLLFVLKVSILNQQKLSAGIIYDPGKQAEEIRKAGTLIQGASSIFPRKEDSVEDLIKGTISYKDAEGNVETIGSKNHIAEEKDKKKDDPSAAADSSSKEDAGKPKTETP